MQTQESLAVEPGDAIEAVKCDPWRLHTDGAGSPGEKGLESACRFRQTGSRRPKLSAE